MDTLGERLEAHTVVGLDTSIFIYHLEDHPLYRPFTHQLFEGISQLCYNVIG